MLITLSDALFIGVQDILHITISSPLVILSPHAGTLAFNSLTTNPTSAGPDSLWASASQSTDSKVSGLLSSRL